MDFNQFMHKKKVVLVGKDLQDADIKGLADVLRESEVVEDINLMCNRITFADDTFTDALAQNRTLKVLSLYNNQVGAEGAKRLAAAIKVNQTLEQLLLEGNEIGDEGAKSLADALMANQSIRVIILRGNKIGDEGAKHLAECFLFNQSLRVVLLGDNKIGNEGAKCLVDHLPYGNMIDQLMVDNNNMSDILEKKISTILSDPCRKDPHREKSLALPKYVVEKLLAHRDRVIQLKDKEIARVIKLKDKEIATKDARISRRDTDIATMTSEIAKKDKKIKAKDEEIASLKAQLAQPLEVLAKFIANKDKQISGLEADIEMSSKVKKQRDKEITSLKAAIIEKTVEVEKKAAEVEEQAAEIKEKNAELEETSNKLKELAIADIIASSIEDSTLGSSRSDESSYADENDEQEVFVIRNEQNRSSPTKSSETKKPLKSCLKNGKNKNRKRSVDVGLE
mmetsp:Transcript_12111/g.25801  ORF Transcript_12111/g.25801 Transcript_12111/m.25801 type:complete len:452 (-) Transcript_12111:205-1560(-)